MMARIRSVDTGPELLIRRGLHARGFRYRLHGKGLPGRPDLVFASRKAVIFVHGCFWHGHDCPLFRWPGTREEFWRQKIGNNIARDARTRQNLLDQGWRVMEVWECALKGKLRWPLDDIIAACADWLVSNQQFGQIQGRVT